VVWPSEGRECSLSTDEEPVLGHGEGASQGGKFLPLAVLCEKTVALPGAPLREVLCFSEDQGGLTSPVLGRMEGAAHGGEPLPASIFSPR
jgi:hypothetical protein